MYKIVFIVAFLFGTASIAPTDRAETQAVSCEKESETQSEAETREWGEPAGGYCFSIWVDQKVFKATEPILLHFQMKCVGKPVRLATGWAFDEILESHLHIELTADPSLDFGALVDKKSGNVLVPRTLYGKMPKLNLAGSSRQKPGTFPPGKIFPVWSGHLNRHYDMSIARKYYLVVSQQIGKDSQGKPIYVESNKLTIVVEESTPEVE